MIVVVVVPETTRSPPLKVAWISEDSQGKANLATWKKEITR